MENYSSDYYLGIKNRYQEDFNKLPIHFAFGNEQWEKELRSMGLDPNNEEDIKKLVGIGVGGGFMLRSDSHLLKDFLKTHNIEEELYKGTEEQIIGAYIYELENHEFMINSQLDFDMEQCFDEIKPELMAKAKEICWDRYYHTDYYD